MYVLGVYVDENSGGGRNTMYLLYKFCMMLLFLTVSSVAELAMPVAQHILALGGDLHLLIVTHSLTLVRAKVLWGIRFTTLYGVPLYSTVIVVALYIEQ